MEQKEITQKQMKFLSVAFTLIVCVAGVGSVVYADGLEERTEFCDTQYLIAEQRIEESSLVGGIIGMLTGIIVATTVMPMIANATKTLESNPDLDTDEQAMVGFWTKLIIIAVMISIIGTAI